MNKGLLALLGLVVSLGAMAEGGANSLPSLTVAVRPVPQTLASDGVLEAVQQAVLAAQVAGRVLEVKVDAGQAVKKGDLLLRIDAREAGEQLAAAEAQYLNARANWERTRRLVEQKFLSQAALDRARSEFDAAAASRAAARAGLSHAEVRSPLTGVVARRHVEAGEMAAPGRELLTLFAPGGLRVTASVPQYRLPALRGVRSARVEFPESGLWLTSSAVQLLPLADAATHASTVRVVLPAPPAGSVLTPGMFARVHFVVGETNKLTVPTAAIVRRGEVSAVYVQAPDGRLALRQLRLGEAVAGGETEVLAGLQAGEKIVTDPIRAVLALRGGR